MPLKTCRVCDASDHAELHLASEKMFGFGGEFAYFRCQKCGCLQIDDPHIDLRSYYPSKYYSFATADVPPPWRRWLTLLRDRAALGEGSLLGRRLLATKPNAPLQSLQPLKLRFDSRIGDVGCGAGMLLRTLKDLGFSHLTGIDPNIEADVQVDHGLRIRKCYLEDISEEFDVLMFHHSLEHIPDQLGVLGAAFNRIVPGGACIVRIPLSSSEAWRRYGTDWVQLDAPRHLYLHSKISMEMLATRAGFVVERVVFDSNEFQFWGSEALREGLRLFDPETGLPNPQSVRIANEGRARWRAEAEELNSKGLGDQASFLLRKPTQSAEPRPTQ